MSPTITETAEAFSRHQFDETYPLILDEAQWTLVRGEPIRGKSDILKACEKLRAAYVMSRPHSQGSR